MRHPTLLSIGLLNAALLLAFSPGLAVHCSSDEIDRGSVPSGDDLLARYEEYLRSFHRLRLTCVASLHVLGTSDRSQRLSKTEQVTAIIDRDGRRIRVMRTSNLLADGGTPADSIAEQLVTPQHHISVTAAAADGKVRSVSTKNLVADRDWEEFVSRSFFSISFGYIPLKGSDGYIPDVMRELVLSSRIDAINNESFFVLEGKSQELNIRLWLNPELSYAAKRIDYRIMKQASTPGTISEYSYEVDSFETLDMQAAFPLKFRIVTKKQGGMPSPSNANAFVKPVSSPDRRMTREVTIKEVAPQTNFAASDFTIQSTIPNGQPVSNVDALHLRYAWQDGAIVPVLDEAADRLARNARFSPGRSSSLFWFIPANLIVFLVVLLIFLRQRLRSRRGVTHY